MSLRLVIFSLAWSGLAVAADSFPPDQIEFFEKSVRPVLAERCYECHGAHKHQNGLRLDSRAAVLRGSDYGKVVEPGQPSASKLIKAITHAPGVEAMPKKGNKLTSSEIAAIEKWVQLGLPWPPETETASHTEKADPMQHWAFQPVKADRSKSLDQLVAAKLQAAGLDFAPTADSATLVRRIYISLTGLPPSYDELQSAIRSNPQSTIAKLLATPAYGEKWARIWLDVVRYADTNGYQVAGRSNFYPYAYTYRDWVVKSLNDDMPYDQFIIRQLAADRVSSPDSPQLAALGFFNIGERFINDRVLITDDRIDVIGRGLLGLTIGCARCHDHKFDPIPSRDYYALYSVMNSCTEPEDPAMPIIGKAANPTDAADYDQKVAEIDKKLLDFKKKIHAELRTPTQIASYLLFAQETQHMEKDAEFRGKAGQRQLRDSVAFKWKNFLKRYALNPKPHPALTTWKRYAEAKPEQFASITTELAKTPNDPVAAEIVKKAPKSLPDVASIYGQLFATGKIDSKLLQDPLCPLSVPVEQIDAFLTRKDRETVVKNENERTKLDSTHPGAPPRAMVLLDKPKPEDVRVFMRGNPARQGEPAPRAWLTMFGGQKFTDGSGRLELANRIASKDNPLTARVLVNRVWMQHFGKPLVAQPSDFGVQTQRPVQAELLDYLADYFIQNGWSLKKLHTLILTSRTWQQSSHATPEKLLKDADNELLSRFNRQRLDYETMRDAILSATGELDAQKRGGRAIELTAKDADTRRTLYLKVDRYDQASVPAMFDFANPESHSPQRFNTTVPQQSLFLMNSPFMRARADIFATAEVESLYRRILARTPTKDELTLAQQFIKEAEALNGEKPFRWSYGMMKLHGDNTFSDFQPFTHLTERAGGGQKLWSPGEKIPDKQWGHAFWANYGGHAAPNGYVVTARWHAPADMQIRIESVLSRSSDRGDGVRGWVHSSRTGILTESTATPQVKKSPIQLTTAVKAGDVISFIVHNIGGTDSDSFDWQPIIHRADTDEVLTNAKNDFCDASHWPFGRQRPQSPTSQLAQVLMMSNEFLFVE